MASRGHGDSSKLELDNLLLKADQRTDESLESTRRMKELVFHSQETGGKTMEMLYYQGEQLERIGTANDGLRENVREANKNLSQMEKCCGIFSGACFRQFICCISNSKASKMHSDNDYYRKPKEKRSSKTSSDGLKSYNTASSDNPKNGGQARGGFIQRITNDAREDEMEENLGEVSTALGQLKNLALDMGQEVARQDSIIDRNLMKTQINFDDVNAARTRAENFLKR